MYIRAKQFNSDPQLKLNLGGYIVTLKSSMQSKFMNLLVALLVEIFYNKYIRKFTYVHKGIIIANIQEDNTYGANRKPIPRITDPYVFPRLQ